MSIEPALNGWQAAWAGANSNITSRPLITQAMLAELEELKRLDARRRQLREELLLLLADNVEIEPGSLWTELQEYETKSLSFAKLCAIGGEAWAEDIKSRIEPTVCRGLLISSDAPTTHGNRPRTANQRHPRAQGRIGGGSGETIYSDIPSEW